MSLTEKISIVGLEADLDIEDHHASVVLQIDGASHWATITLQSDDDIVALRDWLVEYCQLANIGQP